MKLPLGILLLLTVNTALADVGQAIETYRQNQAEQTNQNDQTSTSTNNTVIYGAPVEQQVVVPHAGAEAGVDAHQDYRENHNNRSNNLDRENNHHRGEGAGSRRR